MKKTIFSFILVFALVLCMMPTITVKADLGGWTTAPNGVMTITGTNITVRYQGNAMIIEGIGEIPDYSPATFTKRPWHYYDFDKVVIGEGITRIGRYAFADKTGLKRIDMRMSTFIADGTSFQNIANNPIIRLSGSQSQIKMIGNIQYKSLESIIANAPSGTNCSYIVDNGNVISTMRNMVYPYLKYVYSSTDSSSPWESKKDTTTDLKMEKRGTALTDGTKFFQVQKRPQGELYMQVISNYIKDYTYLYSYSASLVNNKGEITYGTNGNHLYRIQLEPKDQIYNRQYCLMEIGPDGQVLYCPDLDNNFSTVTFETFYPTSTYALVYKYPNINMP